MNKINIKTLKCIYNNMSRAEYTSKCSDITISESDVRYSEWFQVSIWAE